MLHILLLILKIIGIVLLVILGILLLVLLLLLLVPIRYTLRGGYRGKPAVKVRVTWLLHAVSVPITYDEGLSFSVKLLGIRVAGKKPGEAGEKAEEDGEEDQAAEGRAEIPDADDGRDEGRAKGGSESGAAEDKATAEDWTETAGAADNRDEGRTEGGVESGAAEDKTAAKDRTDDSRAAEGSATDSSGVSDDGDVTDVSQLLTVQELTEDEEISEKDGVPDEETDSDGEEVSDDEEDSEEDSAKQKDDRSISEKIAGVYAMVCDKMNWVKEKKEKGLAFIRDPKNRKSFSLLWKETKKLLRHLLPTKARGEVVFGLEDPVTMGKILSACSFLYAMYGNKLMITPDFENQIMEADLNIRGRIRLGTLLVIALRLYFDKNLMKMIDQLRHLRSKEA